MHLDAIVSASTLADWLDAVGALVAEARVEVQSEGIDVMAVDPAGVAQVDATLAVDGFESYDADDGTLGVNTEKLSDVVGMAGGDQLVHLTYDPERRKLVVEIGGVTYTMALIDPQSIRASPDPTDLDLPAAVTVEGDQLAKAVTAVDMVGDHVTIGADAGREELLIAGQGDTDTVDVVYDAADVIAADWGDAESLFSLDYLEDVTKPMPGDAEVTVRVGQEFPMELAYEACEGDVTVENMIAPRIQSR